MKKLWKRPGDGVPPYTVCLMRLVGTVVPHACRAAARQRGADSAACPHIPGRSLEDARRAVAVENELGPARRTRRC